MGAERHNLDWLKGTLRNRTRSKLLLHIDDAFHRDPSALIPAAHSVLKLPTGR